jgi:hypothetical protein
MSPGTHTSRLALATLLAGLLTTVLAGMGLLAEFDQTSDVVTTWAARLWPFAMALTIVIGGVGIYRIRHSQGRLRGARLTGWSLAVFGGGHLFLFCVAVPVCSMTNLAAMRALTANRMQQIGLALHNHNDHLGYLPPAAIRSRDGKPLLSWRVAILPYIEGESLYRQFRLDEPWDSPHNSALLPRMPEVFHLAYDPYTPAHMTYFQAFVGPGTAFEREGLRLSHDFPDGTWNTILFVEAATPVPWTQPVDLPFDPMGPLPALRASLPESRLRRRRESDGFNAVLGDGSVRTIHPRTLGFDVRALITRNGGEAVPRNW